MAMEDILKNATEQNKKEVEEQPKVEEQKVELTKEQEDEIIRKRFGVADVNMVVIKEAPELTEEEKKALEQKEDEEALSVGLEKGWFNKADYDEYQKLKAEDKIEIGKRRFKEEFNIEDDELVSEMLALDEDDTFEPLDDDGEPVVNKKKEIGKSFLERMADKYVGEKFEPVLTAKQKLQNLKAIQKKEAENKQVIDKTINDLPEFLEFEVKGEKYSYKVKPEDKEIVKSEFQKDVALIRGDEINVEDIKENALLYIKSKNLNEVIAEVAGAIAAKQQENYERGQKGLPPERLSLTEGGTTLSEGEEFMKEWSKNRQ